MHCLQPDIWVSHDVAQIDAIDKRLDGIAFQRRNADYLLNAAGHQPVQIAHHNNPQLPLLQLFAPQIDTLMLGDNLPHALSG